MSARLLAALFAVLAVASGTIAVLDLRSEPTGAADTAEVSTPVFSLRRVPGAVARTVAGGRLRAQLDRVLSQPDLGQAREHSCLAVRDPDGHLVYERLVETPLIPASTTKLLTAAVALEKLGPDARYTTAVRAAEPPRDGSVGDLWLVGSGDPLLATADYAAQAGWLKLPRPATPIEDLAERIAGAGVRRIGRLLGDESRYDTQRYIPSWESTYATTPEVGPQSALTVNDGFVQWQARKVPATSPATHGATVLATLLRARGVTVGAVGEGKAPEPSLAVASIDSPPLTELVATIVRHSGNLASELLVKELGVRFGGAGTTPAGLDVLRSTALAMGLPVDGLAAVDGSGLDRSDRITCRLLQDLLAKAGDGGPLAQGMPLAGSSGTLVDRFTRTPAVGKVRAKTGSLNEVVGLAGWTTTLDGRSLQFSLVANELPDDDLGMALQDDLVTALVSYPQAPSPDEIGPAPPQPAGP
jgi:D-alanyl-D-alanine carboxypeptidase/D-alanyl-D-alanine-endopeptidase (penicillin-binding protein 4)